MRVWGVADMSLFFEPVPAAPCPPDIAVPPPILACASTDGRLIKSVDTGLTWTELNGSAIGDGATPVACVSSDPVKAAGVACIVDSAGAGRPALLLFDVDAQATIVWDVQAGAVWVPAPGEELSVECDEFTADIEPVCLVDSAGVFTRRADKITVFRNGVVSALPPTFVDPTTNSPLILAAGEVVGACEESTVLTVEREWCNAGSLWVAVFPMDGSTGAPLYGSPPLAVWDYGPVSAPNVPPLPVLWADLQAAVIAGAATLGKCPTTECETC